MKASTLANGAATRASGAKSPATGHAGLSPDDLLKAYRLMLLSRKIDDKEIQLRNGGKIFFQISGAGHEAVLVAAGLQLRPGYDWFFPYYRDRALCLTLGVTPRDMFLAAAGAAEDPANGGRQMPSHWSSRPLNIPSQSSCVGTHCLHGVGCAEAGLIYSRVAAIESRETRYHADQVTYVSIGEGGTSEGEFWESLNTACNAKAPVLFLVEDNGYAISVPVETQTPGGDISRIVSGFPGLQVHHCDGTDYAASYRTLEEAIGHVRSGKGPALVHATVTRPYSHSHSDDERLYKPPAEREAEARRDPLVRLRALLIEQGIATEDELAGLLAVIEREVNEAADSALEAPKPDPATATRFVYSPDVDPASSRFDAEPRTDATPGTMLASINQTLKDEMGRDPRIVVFGQDVADASRRDALAVVEGKGGVFGVTHGLQKLYGEDRVFNSPLAEANIIGRAVGMALRGLEAGGRDPVLRLHLAGLHADPRRAVDDALPVEQPLVVPGGDSRADRRLPERRRAVPQPERRGDLRALPRYPRRLPVERAGRGRPAPHRHSAATTRCSSASTSTSTGRPTTSAPIPEPTTRCRSARPRWRATAPTWWCSPGARSCNARSSRRSRRRITTGSASR
jgi:2-oxoisovalerate dehydrogenase E1 component